MLWLLQTLLKRGQRKGNSGRGTCFFVVFFGSKPSPRVSMTEPVFVNVYGAQESNPMNRFRHPMKPGGPVRQIGCRTGPSAWESIPGLLKRSTNTDSGRARDQKECRGSTAMGQWGAKRCRLSWLTNSGLVYEPKCGGRGEGCSNAGSQPMSTAVHNSTWSPNKLWRSSSIFILWSKVKTEAQWHFAVYHSGKYPLPPPPHWRESVGREGPK